MELTVVAAVFCRDDKVLCLRRAAGRSMAGLWEFPGGKVERGESLPEALVREINEELQVDITVGTYLGENRYTPDQTGNPRMPHYPRLTSCCMPFRSTTGPVSLICRTTIKCYGAPRGKCERCIGLPPTCHLSICCVRGWLSVSVSGLLQVFARGVVQGVARGLTHSLFIRQCVGYLLLYESRISSLR